MVSSCTLGHTHHWLSVCAAFTIKVILSFFKISIAECSTEMFEGLFTLETIPRSLPCTSGLCLLGGVTVATEHLRQYDNHVHLIQKQSNLRKFPMTPSQLADFVVVVLIQWRQLHIHHLLLLAGPFRSHHICQHRILSQYPPLSHQGLGWPRVSGLNITRCNYDTLNSKNALV